MIAETLSCTAVSKHFGGVGALQDICLSIRSSEITGIVGPNGAGKTTLLNVLTGFVRADKGQCFAGSTNITHLPPHRIARLGVARTFQDVRLIRNMSALDNVMLAHPRQAGEGLVRAILHVAVPPEEISIEAHSLEILQQVGLSEVAGRFAGELSYGQQKLLTLALCLATRAPILLLDEPFSGVDAVVSEKLLELVGALRSQQKTVLFIEHDLSAVLVVADRLLAMSQGRILADGTPDEVLRRGDVLEGYIS